MASLAARCMTGLLPQSCLLCGQASAAQPICPDCHGDFPPLPEQHCPICLEATTHGERCGACLAHPPHFDRVVALHAYAFPLDKLIQAFKYARQFSLAPWWGDALASRIGAVADRVIPLPLHDQRLRERGFNQAGELARHLAALLNIPVDHQGLHKVRATQAQAELALQARRKNLQGAFQCSRTYAGQRILLVDDVMTTGTTLNEAARALRQAGATSVIACVVARTPRH